MHVMLAGQEQNLPSHLLLNSDTSSFVHLRVAAGGVKGEGDDTGLQLTLLDCLEDRFCLDFSRGGWVPVCVRQVNNIWVKVELQ